MPMNGWFWTTDPGSEALTVQMGGAEDWQQTGVCCKIFNSNNGKVIPLTRYRFTSGTDEISHYWSTDWNSEDMGDDPRWIEEGTIGFVFQNEEQGTVPLFRFRGDQGLRYWSTSMQDNRGLEFDITVGWVFPANATRENLVDLLLFERMRPPHCIQFQERGVLQFQTVHMPRNLTLDQIRERFIELISGERGRPASDYEIVSINEGPC